MDGEGENAAIEAGNARIEDSGGCPGERRQDRDDNAGRNRDEEADTDVAAALSEFGDAALGQSAPPADTHMTEAELRTALELAELDTSGDLAELQARYDEYTASQAGGNNTNPEDQS